MESTSRLLRALVDENGVEIAEVAAVFFTTSPDLNAEFPAAAARALGWQSVPLLCGHEMAVPGRLGLCIRVMMLINTERPQSEIRHLYLDGAAALRPDLKAGI